MFSTEKEFEDEVRRIARLLWPAAQYGGAAMVDGQERDGVFEAEEFVHLVECTVSRSRQKAVEDLQKLERLLRKIGARHPDKFVKGWFVTLHEPTADQRAVFQKVRGRIVAVSFDQFRSRLVDARSYLSSRDNYPFGSVRDPETGNARPSWITSPLTFWMTQVRPTALTGSVQKFSAANDSFFWVTMVRVRVLQCGRCTSASLPSSAPVNLWCFL